MSNLAKDTSPGGFTDQLSTFVTFRISQTHARLNAQATQILKAHSDLCLTEWRTISLIAARGSDLSSGEVVDAFGIDKGMFSRTIKQLTARGYVTGRDDPADMRRTLLSLTDKGTKIHKRLLVIMRARQEHLTHNMTEEQREVLLEALSILKENAAKRDF